jgi:hypothetical protein
VPLNQSQIVFLLTILVLLWMKHMTQAMMTARFLGQLAFGSVAHPRDRPQRQLS